MENLQEKYENIFNFYDELLKIQSDILKELYVKTFSKLTEQEIKEFYMVYYAKELMRPTFIYFMYNKYTGFVKIGKSQDPFNRLKSLNSMFKNHFGAENALSLLRVIFIPYGDGYDIEHKYHKIYEKYRVFGEWFDLEPNNILNEIPNFLMYDVDMSKMNDTFDCVQDCIFKNVDDYTFEIFALDTLDEYMLKLTDGNKRVASLFTQKIGNHIDKKYNKSINDNHIQTSIINKLVSCNENKTWEMFKWLYKNKNKYGLSTMPQYCHGELSSKVLKFEDDIEILYYSKLVEEKANKICFQIPLEY